MNDGKEPVGDAHYPWWSEAPWHDAKVAMIYGPADWQLRGLWNWAHNAAGGVGDLPQLN